MQFLWLFGGGEWLPFSKNFPEDPKITKIRILYPKKHDARTYHFTMEVTPQGEKSVLFAITSQSLTLSLFDIFQNKTRT